MQTLEPKHIFEKGLLYHHYANTAYPLTPQSFKEFRIEDSDKIPDFLKSEWDKTDILSLYIHVPFCSVRCKFCEYTVLENTTEETEDEYVALLLKEMQMYSKMLSTKQIAGYDLGGGTPTKLSVKNIKTITDAVHNLFNIGPEITFSIETTPVIAASEPEKLASIYELGYHRISMGVQTVSERLLNELGREGTTHMYEKAVANIRAAGFKQFNIDLMYGFLYQDDSDFENTLNYALSLKPDFITLYRNRYKGTGLEDEAGGVSLYKVIRQYRLAHKILNDAGYEGNFGKNTFSKLKDNYGTSDYLTKRVVEGIPYVGMGLGSQSCGVDYLAYNDGAASKKFDRYKKKVQCGQFPIQDIYSLDQGESIAKMVSVAFYFGFIDYDAFEKRFSCSFTERFEKEISFVIQENLMEEIGNRLYLTERGSDYINGIIPLFYSDRSKREMLNLIHTKKDVGDGEAQFLKAYNIDKFQKPSLAADIALFSTDNKDKQLSILLIKRAEHPFMNTWALPGGFVRPGETVEQTGYRELFEETGIQAPSLRQFYLFSEPGRDPRGWILSGALWGRFDMSSVMTQFGDDAQNAVWFSIKVTQTENQKQLKLTHGTDTLTATLSTSQEGCGYTLSESNGLAFDHGKIIAAALSAAGLDS